MDQNGNGLAGEAESFQGCTTVLDSIFHKKVRIFERVRLLRST